MQHARPFTYSSDSKGKGSAYWRLFHILNLLFLLVVFFFFFLVEVVFSENLVLKMATKQAKGMDKGDKVNEDEDGGNFILGNHFGCAQ